MSNFSRLIAATFIVCAAAGGLFFKWYYAPPDMPGVVLNTKLVAIMNERLVYIIKNMTTEKFPGLSGLAASSAKNFLVRIRSVVQHCNYKRPGDAKNKVVFDIEFIDGTVVKDLYNGAFRCPSSDVPGIPIMRILFKDGLASEIFTDGSERRMLPQELIPTLDGLIKNIISIDIELNSSGYYKGAPTKSDLEKAWSGS